MRKRICGLILGILCTAAFTGCSLSGETDLAGETGQESAEPQKVKLVVWGAAEDR